MADSYDAMTSERPYRAALSADAAATVLRDGRGTQWDPQITDAFLRSITERLSVQVQIPGVRRTSQAPVLGAASGPAV